MKISIMKLFDSISNYTEKIFNIHLLSLPKVANLRKGIILLIFIFMTSIHFSVFANGINFYEQSLRNCEELNSDADDFAAVWNNFENKLYFNSERDGRSYFYSANAGDSLIFRNISKSASPINISGNNQSYVTFYSANEAYLSTYRMDEGRPVMNIFKTFYKKMQWTKPVPVDSLISNAFCAHPAVSPGGRIMIFSSNMGYNESSDTDLWMCSRLNNGSWGNLMSLDELNSAGNEITPFLKGDDTLIFATNGYEGRGGYDLYYSLRVNGSWSRPEPLTAVNTEFDESDPSIINNTLLFASDRPGGLGGLDIYSIRIQDENGAENNSEKPEILIESLITSLRLKYDMTVEYQVIAPYIDRLIDPDMNRNYFAEQLNSRILKTLSSRMKENKNSILICGNKIFPQLWDYLCVQNKIEKHRLVADERLADGQIKSNSTELTSPFASGVELVEPVPPVLDLFINTGEKAINGQWRLLLKNDIDMLILKQGNGLLPEEMSIDISNFGSYLTDLDELVFQLESSGNIIGDFSLTLIKNSAFSIKPLIINRKKYHRYLLLLPNDYKRADLGDYFKSNIIPHVSGNIILNYRADDDISDAGEIADILKSATDISPDIELKSGIKNIPGELIIPNDYLFFELLIGQ